MLANNLLKRWLGVGQRTAKFGGDLVEVKFLFKCFS